MTGIMTVLNSDTLAFPATRFCGGNGDRIMIRNGANGIYP
jgi:hypothetical protein